MSIADAWQDRYLLDSFETGYVFHIREDQLLVSLITIAEMSHEHLSLCGLTEQFVVWQILCLAQDSDRLLSLVRQLFPVSVELLFRNLLHCHRLRVRE